MNLAKELVLDHVANRADWQPLMSHLSHQVVVCYCPTLIAIAGLLVDFLHRLFLLFWSDQTFKVLTNIVIEIFHVVAFNHFQ